MQLIDFNYIDVGLELVECFDKGTEFGVPNSEMTFAITAE
jgi:hypothetical protein